MPLKLLGFKALYRIPDGIRNCSVPVTEKNSNWYEEMMNCTNHTFQKNIIQQTEK
jgi:hypothetical protein